MIDIQLIRNDVEKVIKDLSKRNQDFSFLRIVKQLDITRREKLQTVEKLKNERNNNSKEIGIKLKNKEDVSNLTLRTKEIGIEISSLDKEIEELEIKIKDYLLKTPNILDERVPLGKEDESVLIKEYLKPTVFDFEIKSHYELGEQLDILDFPRGVKIAGPRFVVYKGLGARLERSLIQFMMDVHANNNYKEIIPPYIINKDSMTTTGQLPKFEEDAFKLTNDYYLNPTAEVPTINMHRDEIIPFDQLPLRYVSYTTAFRSEAGSAGKDTKGLIRTHQFNKVELIKITSQEESEKEHIDMLKDSESILQLLGIPYRVVILCSGDVGSSMSITYDIEVWIPSQNKYREIGSISNARDYQARRGAIRYKDKNGNILLTHTLNGSGLAVSRTWVALVENFQQKNGSIIIPNVLTPYMKVDKII